MADDDIIGEKNPKDGNHRKLPILGLSKKALLILIGSIAICAILFGLYKQFSKHFSPITMFRIWNTSYKVCSKMYETHEVIVNTFVSCEKNGTFRIIQPYLPTVPDPGDWLNGRISIV